MQTIKRNFQITPAQDEWLTRRAMDLGSDRSAVVRDLIDRAMAEKKEGPKTMRIEELVEAAEAGCTLREVLEAAYNKPAEAIGVEGAELDQYRHDLDKPVMRVYAQFNARGYLTGDVALVAGDTIWQDHETANIVTSVDEELEDTFRQTWVRVYPDMDAVFVHNNAYDTILVANGAQPALAVDPDTFRAFAEQPGDWSNWGSPESWAEHGDTIGEAAVRYGQIVAYYDGQTLEVVDPRLWAGRRRFYGLDK